MKGYYCVLMGLLLILTSKSWKVMIFGKEVDEWVREWVGVLVCEWVGVWVVMETGCLCALKRRNTVSNILKHIIYCERAVAITWSR